VIEQCTVLSTDFVSNYEVVLQQGVSQISTGTRERGAGCFTAW
jgi:hypothetical protein